MTKGITPKICRLCVCIIKISVLLNLLCVWILLQIVSSVFGRSRSIFPFASVHCVNKNELLFFLPSTSLWGVYSKKKKNIDLSLQCCSRSFNHAHCVNLQQIYFCSCKNRKAILSDILYFSATKLPLAFLQSQNHHLLFHINTHTPFRRCIYSCTVFTC